MPETDPLDAAIAGLVSTYPLSAARYARRNPTAAYALPDVFTTEPPRPLSVQEAVELQAATSDTRVLHAEAAALRHGCVPLVDFDRVPDIELLRGYAAWHSCLGELLLTVTQAVHNQHISRADFARIQAALHEDAARGFAFLARMKALIHAE